MFIELTFMNEGFTTTYKASVNINHIVSIDIDDTKNKVVRLWLVTGAVWYPLETYEEVRGLIKEAANG